MEKSSARRRQEYLGGHVAGSPASQVSVDDDIGQRLDATKSHHKGPTYLSLVVGPVTRIGHDDMVPDTVPDALAT